jgi:hypothetical protein
MHFVVRVRTWRVARLYGVQFTVLFMCRKQHVLWHVLNYFSLYLNKQIRMQSDFEFTLL